MDQQTEDALIPHIALEALAKGIIEAVRALNRRVTAAKAKASQSVALTPPASAPPVQEMAQLAPSAVSSLLASPQGWAVQNDFMGEEWVPLLRSDIQRFVESEKMSAATPVCEHSAARMAWVHPDEALKERYPALAELLQQLHQLPFELNHRAPAAPLELLEPAPGCTLLLRFPRGASQAARLDSRCDGSHLDSGIRITCAYHLLGQEPGPGSRYHLLADEPLVQLPIASDMLVLHNSAAVRNARSEASSEYFAVLFFILGRPRAS